MYIQIVRLHVISSKLDSEAETNWLLYVHVMSWWSGGAGSGGVVGGGNIWNPYIFSFFFFEYFFFFFRANNFCLICNKAKNDNNEYTHRDKSIKKMVKVNSLINNNHYIRVYIYIYGDIYVWYGGAISDGNEWMNEWMVEWFAWWNGIWDIIHIVYRSI